MNIKNRKSTISLLCFAVLGLGIGWSSNSYLDKLNESTSAPSTTKVDLNTIGSTDKTTAIPTTSDTAKETESILSLGPETLSKEESLLQSIINESSDTKLTASHIINYIALRSEREHFFVGKERGLRKLLRESPEINYELIAQYSDISEPQTRRNLADLLAQSNMSHRPFLEPKLMEKIKQNEDRSAMLELLGEWGSQSKSNIEYLAQEIPFMENPEDTAAAISAISQSSWVYSNRLSPEEFKQLTSLVNDYRSSEYPKERAAAVAALRTMPSENYQQQIIESINDPSALVRQQALNVYGQSPFDKKSLIRDLVQRVQDQDIGYAERSHVAAVLMLSNVELSEDQLKTVNGAQKEIEDFLSSLSEQERKELYSTQGS